jgi:hypothetical protein
MPWKERYTISDEKSLGDDEIRWPQGARCCVGITVDLSVAVGDRTVFAPPTSGPRRLNSAPIRGSRHCSPL